MIKYKNISLTEKNKRNYLLLLFTVSFKNQDKG